MSHANRLDARCVVGSGRTTAAASPALAQGRQATSVRPCLPDGLDLPTARGLHLPRAALPGTGLRLGRDRLEAAPGVDWGWRLAEVARDVAATPGQGGRDRHLDRRGRQ